MLDKYCSILDSNQLCLFWPLNVWEKKKKKKKENHSKLPNLIWTKSLKGDCIVNKTQTHKLKPSDICLMLEKLKLEKNMVVYNQISLGWYFALSNPNSIYYRKKVEKGIYSTSLLIFVLFKVKYHFILLQFLRIFVIILCWLRHVEHLVYLIF